MVNVSNVAIAGDMGLLPASTISQAGLFIGLGGNYNSVKFDQTYPNISARSQVYSGTTVLAAGGAGGPGVPLHHTDTTFSPEAQVGYFRYFTGNSDLLWGVKFQYQYLGITLTGNDSVAFQSGTLLSDTPAGGSLSFTGHASIQSIQNTATHELALLPFIGHSFISNSYTYFGIGPSLFQTQTHVYDVMGHADLNGVPADATGAPVNFSSATWLVGGAAQMGVTYFPNSTWSLDVNYTYSMSGRGTTKYTSPYSNTSGSYTSAGTLFGTLTQRVTAQALTCSINKVFAL